MCVPAGMWPYISITYTEGKQNTAKPVTMNLPSRLNVGKFVITISIGKYIVSKNVVVSISECLVH